MSVAVVQQIQEVRKPKKRLRPLPWEGEYEVLEKKLLTAPGFNAALSCLNVIAKRRPEIPRDKMTMLEFKTCVEFCEEFKLKDVLNHKVSDIIHIVRFIVDQYDKYGRNACKKYSICFRDMTNEKLVMLFRRGCSLDLKRATRYHLALEAVRPEAFVALSNHIFERLRSYRGKIPFLPDIVGFIEPMLCHKFGTMKPDEVLLTWDVGMKYHALNNQKNIAPGMSDLDRKMRHQVARLYVMDIYPLMYYSSAIMGYALFHYQCPRNDLLLESILYYCPNKLTIPSIRILAFAITLAKLNCPTLSQNQILCPLNPAYLRNYNGKSRSFSRRYAYERDHQLWMCFLIRIVKKYPILEPEFQTTISLCPDGTEELLLLVFYYAEYFMEGFKYARYLLQQEKHKDNPHFTALLISFLFAMGREEATLEISFKLLKIAIEKEWTDESTKIIYFEKHRNKVHTGYLPVTDTAHWICALITRVLKRLIAKKKRPDDILLATLVIMSQLDFEIVGHKYYNFAMKYIKRKKIFRERRIGEFLSEAAILGDFLELEYERKNKFVFRNKEDVPLLENGTPDFSPLFADLQPKSDDLENCCKFLFGNKTMLMTAAKNF